MAASWHDADNLIGAYGQLRLLGMTTIAERAFAHAHVARCYEGRGEILDLGCWLGSLTVPMCRGLAENPHEKAARRFIHSYDLFVWQQWMEDLAPAMSKELIGRFTVGDSFLPDFQRVVAPWSDRIRIYEGSILDKPWDGNPVEFMYVDAMKDWGLTCGIHNNFMRYLLPGGYVAHQDFAFHGVPWLHLYTYRLREYLAPVHHVPGSFTVLFQLARALPDALHEVDWDYGSYSSDEVELAFNWAASLVGEEKKPDIALAQALCWFWRGEPDRASRIIDQVAAASTGLTQTQNNGIQMLTQLMSKSARRIS